MNILVLNLSMLNAKSDYFMWKSSLPGINGFETYGKQTNEAPAKFIIKKLDNENRHIDKQKENPQYLDRIICVTSAECRKKGPNGEVSTVDYFKDAIEKFCEAENIHRIPEIVNVDVDINDSVTEKLSRLTAKIETDTVCYIDTTGGKRDDMMLIQLLMKMLKYRGIKIGLSVYANYQDKTVYDCGDTYNCLDVLDGVNQFVTSGKASILSGIFEHCEDENVKRLLYFINRFCECLQLSMTDELDEILESLHCEIESFKNGTDGNNSAEIFLLRQAIPLIEEKFFAGLRSGNKIDYCYLVKWCAENGLIQQAITIYTEKIPKYLFSAGIVSATEEEKKNAESQAKLNKNAEMQMWYSSMYGSFDASIYHFSRWLKDKQYQTNELYARKAILLYVEFEKITRNCCSIDEGCDEQISNCYNSTKNFYKKIKAIAKECNLNDRVGDINDTLKSFRNSVSNDRNKIIELLKVCSEGKKIFESNNIIDKKIAAIEIFSSQMIPCGYSVNCAILKLKMLMRDYLWVKCQRNKINHASDEENLNEEQKNYFKKYGYKTDDLSVDDIAKKLKTSIEFIQQLSPLK